MNKDCFPKTHPDEYWTSTSGGFNVADGMAKACTVDFSKGYFSGEGTSKNSVYYVRAVRGQNQRLGRLAILNPAQASYWQQGNTLRIQWDTQGIDGKVSISISREGGKPNTFVIIEENWENNGVYDWIVTGPGSVNCMLKIKPLNSPDKGTQQGLFTILGNGLFQFNADSYTVDETAGTAAITVKRVDGTDGAVSVRYRTQDGTAKANTDYTDTTDILEWGNGDSEPKTFHVPISYRDGVQGERSLTLEIYDPRGSALLGSPREAELKIQDGPPTGTVSVNVTPDSASWTISGPSGFEGNGQTFTGDRTFTNAPEGSYSWTGQALEGYETPSSETLPLNSGETISFNKTWIIEDARIIRISGDLGFGDVTVGNNPTRTMTIYNDGNDTLTVTSIAYPSGFDGDWNSGNITAGGSQPVTVTFSPTAEQSYGGTITVNSDKTEGTNTHSCSGTGVPIATGSLEVTIRPQGAIDAGAQWRVDGGTWHDTGYAENDLSLGNHAVEYRTISGWSKPENEAVEIKANETTNTSGTYTVIVGALQFESTAYSVEEDAGSLEVCVIRTNGSTGAASVTYATADGTAKVVDGDYASKTDQLQWADGSFDKECFDIPIHNDTEPENSESFTVSLTNATGAGLGSPSRTTVQINGPNDQSTGIRFVSKTAGCGGAKPCHNTIQEAVSASQSGETIRIGQGTFTGTITLDDPKSLTFEGGWDESWRGQTSRKTRIQAPDVSNGGSIRMREVDVVP